MTRNTTLMAMGALAAAVVLNMMTTGAAMAQQVRNCGPRELVVNRLADRYGETRQSMGLGANNAVLEVFASDESGTWTVTVTSPEGMTCLIASGQAFEELVEALPAKGNDA
ncbi:hypothetical protein [Tateyamaria sp.]|uniref:hypothetical protein n=1 Tax=Tateyamaria sp. TaxID=1929288 RepID=UPI00329DBA45